MRAFNPWYFLLVLVILVAFKWSSETSLRQKTQSTFNALPLPALTPLEGNGQVSDQIKPQVASFTMRQGLIKSVALGGEAPSIEVATATRPKVEVIDPNDTQALRRGADSAIGQLKELVTITEADSLPPMLKIEAKFDQIAQTLASLNLASPSTEQQKQLRVELDETITRSVDSMNNNLLHNRDKSVAGKFQIQIAKLMDWGKSFVR